MGAISFIVEGEPQLIQSLERKKTQLIDAFIRKVDVLDVKLQSKIQGKLSGEVLQHRSGNLIRSIDAIPAKLEGDLIIGAVQGGGGVAFYGKFHEFGTSGSYEIVPVNKKVLAFLVGGKQVFARRVLHPPIKERSFMRSSQDEMRAEIIEGLQATVGEVASQ